LRTWQYSPPASDRSASYRETLKAGATVAELLARLDIEDSDEVRRFLNPRLAEIACPFEIANLKAAAQRISQAIEDRQQIVICGDYDVDGVTSTALLVDVLRRFDCYPFYIVPRRLEEGYGLSQKTVERALTGAKDPDLFIALDCGTNSLDEARLIRESGCDLIIVDHHQSKAAHSAEVILVNPHAHDSDADCFRQLCTVGLVFKLCHGLLKLRRSLEDKRALAIKLRHYLDLVAMGTVADMVPLRQENRVFAKIGLEVLSRSKRLGLSQLMRISGVGAKKAMSPVDISFKLGPRINASGRLADASLAVELLLSEDPAFCLQTALELDSFNRERQEIERCITAEAAEEVEREQRESSGLVVHNAQWHSGVVGIVASRLSRTYNRPAIVLGREGDLAKGSGRSIDGVDLTQVLAPFSERLESWGGHPMAVGISLKPDRVAEFRRFFDRALKSYLETHAAESALQISSWLSLGDISTRLMDELSLLEPFGQANPEPVFASRRARFSPKLTVFKDLHFRFALTLSRGESISGVAWNMAERIPPANTPIDIAYRLSWNTFGNGKTLQMQLLDWRLAE